MKTFHCRECGRYHVPALPERYPEPMHCTCGSGYQIHADGHVHHFTWGPNYTGPPRLLRLKLPPLPSVTNAVKLPPLKGPIK